MAVDIIRSPWRPRTRGSQRAKSSARTTLRNRVGPSGFGKLAVLVLAVAGGAACSSNQTCDIDVLAAESLDGVAATDCGNLVAQGDEHPELEEAHDCVANALDTSTSFLVIWKYAGFEGDVSSAYVGKVASGQLILEHYQRAPDGAGNFATSRRECANLTPMTTCDSSLLRGFLCLECKDPSSSDVICPLDS